MSKGIALLVTERVRQVVEEGYTPAHDAGHEGEIALAAQGYSLAAADDLGVLSYIANNPTDPPADWPWHISYWRPTSDPVRDLTKAGGLIAAALDSLLADPADPIIPAPIKHPADVWVALTGVLVLDPDGWDRKNSAASWAEPITFDEFHRRCMRSTSNMRQLG